MDYVDLWMYVCVFDGPSGHAEWLGQGEQQSEGPGVPKADCPGTAGGDGPAAFQAGGNGQRRKAEVPGRVPDG